MNTKFFMINLLTNKLKGAIINAEREIMKNEKTKTVENNGNGIWVKFSEK